MYSIKQNLKKFSLASPLSSISPHNFKLLRDLYNQPHSQPPPKPQCSHFMHLCSSTLQTRSANLAITTPPSSNFLQTEPRTFCQANKYPVWNNAMFEEINALLTNST